MQSNEEQRQAFIDPFKWPVDISASDTIAL